MIELLNIDCMEYMATCEDDAFDLAIVDPPYGLGKRIVDGGSVSPFIKSQNGKVKQWDIPPDKLYFDELFRVSKNQIIWGANYFFNLLNSTRCFLIWDKTIYGNTYSDCELAWTSFNSPARFFTKNIVDVTTDGRIHPTQKPISLYKWLLKNYAEPGQRILDTHLGSGSSAIAAHYFGCDFVGCEIDKEYFDAMMKRFKCETSQVALFEGI